MIAWLERSLIAALLLSTLCLAGCKKPDAADETTTTTPAPTAKAESEGVVTGTASDTGPSLPPPPGWSADGTDTK